MILTKLHRQSRTHQLLTILRERYDEHGAEDGTYFDTYRSNIKRTIRTLERLGYVVAWEDAEDPTRLWAAAKPRG